MGYSDTNNSNEFDTLELSTNNWKVEPLEVNRVETSFFNDKSSFPDGTVEFDSALLMENIYHHWISHHKLMINN